jgi:lipopolysaccharide transport system permease protein
MHASVTELYHYRDLLYTWTIRELQIRYKQSILGGLWAILQPLALMILFAIIFSVFVKIPSDGIPYPIFAYTALLPWTYFATAISFGVPSLVSNMNLVTKVYFPREILPLASIAAALVDFLIASGILGVLMLYYQISFQFTILWMPILILVQTVFMAGVVLFAAAVNALYHDVRFVIPLLIQVWMYATPIIYPMSVVPERLRPFYLLNPMAGLINSYRRVILQGHSPDPIAFGMALGMALIALIAGYLVFKYLEGIIPDVI